MASRAPLRVRAYCPRCRAAADLEGDRLRGAWACGCGEAKELPGPFDSPRLLSGLAQGGPSDSPGPASGLAQGGPSDSPGPASGLAQGGPSGSSGGSQAAADASEDRVRRCAFCGCASLYIEKDFHQGLGCAIMAAAPVLPLFFPMVYGKGLLVSVLSLAAVDWILYYAVIPFRTVCYRCCAEHRGGTLNPDHKPYDLSTAELFQERGGQQR